MKTAETQGGGLRGAGGRAARALARPGPGKAVLDAVLKDDILFWALRNLANHESRTLRFETSVPPDLRTIDGFEDVAWLFSQNELSHGLARLRFEEAACFWKLIDGIDHPAVAEVGRYRGGTAFLFAAAGADVLSIDNDAPLTAADAPGLEAALGQCGLGGRVEIVTADGRDYPVTPDSFDLVFIDALQTYDGAKALFEHWWPTVKEGGHLFLRNAMEGDPAAANVLRVVAEAERRPDVERLPTIGQCAHFRRQHAEGAGR